ncbi:MAG: ribokinase, partial [Anaerolineae bacterium]|nr:ribokinase [Anaerolineae bacterium]
EGIVTSGAGDAFNACLAGALAAGNPLAEAVRYANCAGSIACTKLGVIPSLGMQAQVDQFYAEHYG